MLNDTESADWLEDEIMRIAKIDRLVEVEPAIKNLHAECKERRFEQPIGRLRTMVDQARNSVRDDQKAEQAETAGNGGGWKGRSTLINIHDHEDAATSYLTKHAIFKQKRKGDRPPKLVWKIAHWRGVFYRWCESHWEAYEPGLIEKHIFLWLSRDCYQLVPSGEKMVPAPVNPGQGLVHEVVKALAAVTHRDGKRVYGWATKKAPIEHPLPCLNGILNLDTLHLHPHTPLLFNTSFAAAEWDPEAPAFENTDAGKWLASALGGEAQMPLVQEMLGYFLSGRTDLQKAFMLTGPTRSGKGTLGRVVGALLGGNVASATTRSLAGPFGLQGLVDKSVCLLPDMRVDKHTNLAALAETILTITGEDMVNVDRKNLPPWYGKLDVRFLMISNSVPRLRDSDGVLYRRFVFLEMPNSYYGQEDPDLFNRIWSDPGVWLKWAVDGARRLNSAFTETPVTKRIGGQAAFRLDPVGSWIAKELKVTGKAGDQLTVAEMFAQFEAFAEDHNIDNFTSEGFARIFWSKDIAGISKCKITRNAPGLGLHAQVRGAKGVRFGDDLTEQLPPEEFEPE